MTDKERDIEEYFVTQVRKAGGWPVKLTSPGNAGMPDRMVLWPGGAVDFVELKRPGGKVRPLQLSALKRLQELGFAAFVISDRGTVDIYTGKIPFWAAGNKEPGKDGLYDF